MGPAGRPWPSRPSVESDSRADALLQALLADGAAIPGRPLDDEALADAAEALIGHTRRTLATLTPEALVAHARAAMRATMPAAA
ncbi:hypothetical protein ACFRCI_10315 [Streptomyces sp. NPDC056638]|uniref:hypothetical protein n=1 Tax=Streptomyces sp. NPDC056638 TaxID=3345887 RepID=UPI0036D082C3